MKELDGLRVELLRQWLSAHADHCGCKDVPWPEPVNCQWKMPEVISGRLDDAAIRKLLLEADGTENQSVGVMDT